MNILPHKILLIKGRLPCEEVILEEIIETNFAIYSKFLIRQARCFSPNCQPPNKTSGHS